MATSTKSSSPPKSADVKNVRLAGTEIRANIIETFGNTPLVKFNALTRGMRTQVVAKLEMMNPGGSVKDRIGIRMIEEAERKGWLRPGGTIVEPTSGNTGVGLAMAAAKSVLARIRSSGCTSGAHASGLPLWLPGAMP